MIGETFEVAARALPADPRGGRKEEAGAETGADLAEGDGARVDGAPGTDAVEREDANPRAGDGAIESAEVSGFGPRGGNKVRQAERGVVGDGETRGEDRHDEIVVAAGYELRAGAIEGAPAGVAGERGNVGFRTAAAEGESGADGRAPGVFAWVRRGPDGAGGGVAGIAEREEAVELARPSGRSRFELREGATADGAERGVGGENGGDEGEVVRGEDVVVVDEDEKIAGCFSEAAKAGGGEAELRFAHDAGVRVPRKIERSENGRIAAAVVDEDKFPRGGVKRLGAQAGDRARETARVGVVGGDNDGDQEW